MAPELAGHGRTGSIVVERVTQRFPLPREEREFTALQGVSVQAVAPGILTVT